MKSKLRIQHITLSPLLSLDGEDQSNDSAASVCFPSSLSYSRRSEKGDVKERWENIFDPDSFIQQIRRAKETFSLIVIIMFDPEVRKQSYLCGSSIS